MKLSVISLLATAADASHFRAIAYAISDKDANTVTITRTMAWRQNLSGYSGGCDKNDVAYQAISDDFGSEDCFLMTGELCGSLISRYVVTDIEDQLTSVNNYCYGYEEIDFPKPTGPYQITWKDCCWVDFTDDQNARITGGSIGIMVSIYDQNNNTPTVKLPPIWKIMAGCDNQMLNLNPVDLDNNKIKCRWSDSTEGRGAYDGKNSFSSISLDEENCILTYDGSQDLAPDGVKPVAIQIEDFDRDGTVLSSTPIQFLATVWTPNNSHFRMRGQYGLGKPFNYQSLFPETDDNDNHRETSLRTKGRRQITQPNYCHDKPVLVAPCPAAGFVISVSSAGVKINVAAKSGNGPITRFQFNSPIGMICNNVNSSGQATCTFRPTSSQIDKIFSFCFMADDVAGMSTERRCITLDVRATSFEKSFVVNDIFTMIRHRVPTLTGQFENYGCAGVNNMDADAGTKGSPRDGVDVAINTWKKCVKCAQLAFSVKYQSYDYEKDFYICGKSISN